VSLSRILFHAVIIGSALVVMEIIRQMTWGNMILYYLVAIYEFVEANAIGQFTSTCLNFKLSHFCVSLFKFFEISMINYL